MGILIRLLMRILKLIFYFVIIAAFVVFIPNLPPYTKFTRIEIEPTQARVDTLAPNDILNNVEKLYHDKLLGPEAFQIWNGDVYTGLATGEIVKVSPGGHVTFVTKIGQPCSLINEHICGRPLGFVIDESKKMLYVADAYHGIWKINLATDKKQLLVSPQVEIDGRIPKLFNSVLLDNNDGLYWTDSSSDFQLKDGVFASLADPTGRLLYYNFAKNESKVLLDELWFPNGLVISSDKSFILVVESSKYRLIKYYISGDKKGTSEVFVAGLPGIPDNIRSLPDGSGVLVSLYSVFDDDNPLIVKAMAGAPLARKFIARVFRMIEIPFEFLQSQFPNYIFENIVYTIGSFGSVASLTPGMSGLVHIDWNGNIIASYYNTDRSVYHISDAVVVNNKLYLGCPHLQNFIGAVPAPPQLIKAFTTQESPTRKSQFTAKPIKENNKPNVESVKTTPQPPKTTTTTRPESTKATTPQSPKTTTTTRPKSTKATTPQPPKSTTNQPTESAKVTTSKPPTNETPKKQKTHSNENLKESANKNAPKEATPKVATKEAVNLKQKETSKPASQPKQVEKNEKTTEESKLNVKKQIKEAEIKLKAAPENTNARIPKETVTKTTESPQPNLQKPKSEQKEASSDQKPTISKNQEAPEKPIIKKTDNKVKNSREEVKEKETSDLKDKAAPDSDIKNKNKIEPTESKAKKSEAKSVKKAPKNTPTQIPIEEEIPSDTAKPSKETLKVIKKTGPQEIPNPNL